MGTPDPGDGRVQSDVRAEEAAATAQGNASSDDPRTVPELQEELRDRGKPTSGTKQELIDRLAEPDDE